MYKKRRSSINVPGVTSVIFPRIKTWKLRVTKHESNMRCRWLTLAIPHNLPLITVLPLHHSPHRSSTFSSISPLTSSYSSLPPLPPLSTPSLPLSLHPFHRHPRQPSDFTGDCRLRDVVEWKLCYTFPQGFQISGIQSRWHILGSSLKCLIFRTHVLFYLHFYEIILLYQSNSENTLGLNTKSWQR